MIRNTAEIRDDDSIHPRTKWLEITPEAIEKLSAEWSEPLEVKIEDDEMFFRIPDSTPESQDTQHADDQP
jgi:hypothetical protein